MSSPAEEADAYRAAAGRLVAAAEADIIAAYQAVYSSLVAEVDALLLVVEAEGVTTSTALYRLRRYQSLMTNIEGELAAFGRVVEGRLLNSQEVAVRMAVEAATRQLPGSVAPLNRRQVEQIVGRTSGGSTVGRLLARIAPDGAAKTRAALVRGVVLGTPVRTVARDVRTQLGVPLARALTITQTETIRAGKEATRAAYEANGVEVWEWRSSRTKRSCALCWGMHGRRFPVRRSVNGHPRCRCTMVPVTSRSGLAKTGDEHFEALADEDKRRVLGSDRAFEAYKRGELSPSGMVEVRNDKKYGPTAVPRR